jgi:hypothetical protein
VDDVEVVLSDNTVPGETHNEDRYASDELLVAQCERNSLNGIERERSIALEGLREVWLNSFPNPCLSSSGSFNNPGVEFIACGVQGFDKEKVKNYEKKCRPS